MGAVWLPAMILIALLALPAPAAATNSPSIVVQPLMGRAGSPLTLKVSGFLTGAPVDVTWISPYTDQIVHLGHAPGPSFVLTFVVPEDTPPSPSDKPYVISAVQEGGVVVSTPFYVLPPYDPYPVPPSLPRSYRMVAADGGVFAFGDAGFHGSTGGMALNAPIVGMARTPTNRGYWLVASDGGIFAFGDARFLGSMGGRALAAPIVGMASTPSGAGYWLVAADGGIFAFGDAVYRGSTGGLPLAAPVVGMARTLAGDGYWLAGRDGGIFAFGAAPFLGSTPGMTDRPVVGIATGTQVGYWTVDVQGYVFNFGDFWAAVDPYQGRPPVEPVVGIAPSGHGIGHWVASDDGSVFALRDAPFFGSLAGVPLARPIVGIAA